MSKHFKTLRQLINIIFLIQVVVVFLIAFGVWPRVLIIPLAVLIAVFVLRADLETSTAFFIRSVPLFVAIPFTDYFDSFNIWRITGGLIFLKWIYKSSRENSISKSAIHLLENSRAISRGSKVGRIVDLLMAYPLASLLVIFLITSVLSLLVAENFFTGLKRVIYLINLSLVPIVIYNLVKKSPALSKKFLGNILISGAIVAGVGLAQLISTYLMPLDAFLDFWGNTIQRGFYGNQWSNIALEANTWFAYFGTQLSLRVFSTFPDSHSFPVYLLMTIPALLALTLEKVFLGKSAIHLLENSRAISRGSKVGGIADLPKFKKLIHTRASWLIILLPVFYLLAILSGTRGVWLAILGPFLILPFLIKKTKQVEEKNILKYLGLLLLPFLILFSMAFPIMGSNQFGLQKEDNQILGKRLRSIIDLEETSNNGRVEIWKKTVESIIHHPFLGVGIGNFPTVLSQHTDLAKAGSSAHNLYLHIAAEIGLFGLLAVFGILALILKRAWRVFTDQGSTFLGIQDRTLIKIYSAGFILYSLWVLFYSLTDAILFDERVFLVFAINSAIILGLDKTKDPLRV